MLKTGFLARWGVQFILLLTVSCGRTSSAQQKTSQLLVSLVSNGKAFYSANQVELKGAIKNKGEGETEPLSSVFRVGGPNGDVVFSQDGAFHIGDVRLPRRLKGSMVSSNRPSLPKTLGEGTYRAVWTANGISSNVVRFQVRSSRDERPMPALSIEAVVLEKPFFQDECISGYF